MVMQWREGTTPVLTPQTVLNKLFGSCELTPTDNRSNVLPPGRAIEPVVVVEPQVVAAVACEVYLKTTFMCSPMK